MGMLGCIRRGAGIGFGSLSRKRIGLVRRGFGGHVGGIQPMSCCPSLFVLAHDLDHFFRPYLDGLLFVSYWFVLKECKVNAGGIKAL